MAAAIEASGTEIVTVALRRVDLDAADDILGALDPSKILLLTNTSGAVDADEAVRLARLARAAGLPDWIKLEVTPDPRYLLPDPVETLRAAEKLVAEGFTVLPYVNADPVLCKRLEEAGCATVMPLGSWIGSNQGLRTRAAHRDHRRAGARAGGRRRRHRRAVATPPRPWRSAPTPCSSTPPSAPPATRCHGRRLPPGGRRPAGPATGPACPAPDRVRRRRLVTAHRLPVVVTVAHIDLESRPSGVPEGTAAADVLATDLGGLRRLAATATAADVDRALRAGHRSLGDFAALLSPAAAGRLEELAAAAHRDDVRRFGRTMHLFAPLYLSNECVSCAPTAGSRPATRSPGAPSRPTRCSTRRASSSRGFRHLLLVAGEHARIVSKDYLVECVRRWRRTCRRSRSRCRCGTPPPTAGSSTPAATAWSSTRRPTTAPPTPRSTSRARSATTTGASRRPTGAPRRACAASASPPCSACTTTGGPRPSPSPPTPGPSSVAGGGARCRWPLPRLRPAAGGFEPADPVGDRDFVQLLCALRLVLPDVGITMSTREPPELRDALLRLGVTHMSAGSHTEPGGYAGPATPSPSSR